MKLSEIKIGQDVYFVDYTNNALNRKKFSMTDENGVEWHRYDRVMYDYFVTKMTLVGILRQVKEGIVPEEAINPVDYYFTTDKGKTINQYDYGDTEKSGIYATEAEAIAQRDESMKRNFD